MEAPDKAVEGNRKNSGYSVLISLFCTVDLGLNVLFNTQPELHDGLGVCSFLHAVFGVFGDSAWTFDRFFAAFKNAAWITYALLAGNAVLHFCCEDK